MRHCFTLLVAISLIGLGAAWCAADDFRVETKIIGKDAKVISENLTLFQAGRVYDFLTPSGGDDQRISILDQHAGRIVLLDPTRRVRTEFKCDRLVELTSGLKSWAARQSDPLLKFAAEPKFTEVAGETGDDLTFSSPAMTYRIRMQKPASPNAARQYWEFSDTYARLNAATSPGSLPPFPRLALNEALAKREVVPKEVELSIAPRGRLGGKPTVKRAEHVFMWRLLDTDQRRIDDAAESLVTYALVDLDEYQKGEADINKLSAKGN